MRNQDELLKSHAAGFGGSDAKMFAKIGHVGISALSTTEKKRILVALGKMKPETFGGNVYTEAGHLFEDYCANAAYSVCKGMEREKYIELKGSGEPRNFKVFAHADFYDDTTHAVVECKYSQDETMKVYEDYYAQLQWYYMIGVDNVTLLHGWGKVLPFEVVGVLPVEVDKDDEFIYWLRHGISILDQAIEDGVFDGYDTTEVTISELSDVQLQACEQLTASMRTIKEIESKAEESRATLLAWMEANGILSIKGDGFMVSYVSPTTRKTFDTKKAQADFPALKDDQYYKTSAVKSSVKITLKP